MLRFTILVCVVTLACKGDDKKAPAANTMATGSAAANPSGTSAAGSDTGGMNMGSNPAGVVPDAGPKLTCDKVVPQAVRDTLFKDVTLADNPKPNAWEGECTIKGKAPTDTGLVMANCHESQGKPEARERTLGELKKLMKDAKDLPGVGVAAVQASATQVTAFNDKCHVNIVVPAGLDPVAIAKAVLPLLPPK